LGKLFRDASLDKSPAVGWFNAWSAERTAAALRGSPRYAMRQV